MSQAITKCVKGLESHKHKIFWKDWIWEQAEKGVVLENKSTKFWS